MSGWLETNSRPRAANCLMTVPSAPLFTWPHGGNVFVTTTFTIEGHEIVDYKGIVRGIIVRSPTITQGIFGGLKSIIGGQIGAYAEMCEQAREQAYELLLQHAADLGANAIVGMRYDASEVGGKTSSTEVLCYGTAVVVRPARQIA
jgi:uncharacterized protein YbjQ (UPF0145 family)